MGQAKDKKIKSEMRRLYWGSVPGRTAKAITTFFFILLGSPIWPIWGAYEFFNRNEWPWE
jgi:hypothetical protein